MGSTIYFAAGQGEAWLSLRVDEDVNGVFEAWTAAQGLPFALTDGGDKVCVNPATVAHWKETRSGVAYF
jgi:hypothetical protein